jgi:hypothetical protein
VRVLEDGARRTKIAIHACGGDERTREPSMPKHDARREHCGDGEVEQGGELEPSCVVRERGALACPRNGDQRREDHLDARCIGAVQIPIERHREAQQKRCIEPDAPRSAYPPRKKAIHAERAGKQQRCPKIERT